jgi:membrane fusion protein (multidrug efflux system)
MRKLGVIYASCTGILLLSGFIYWYIVWKDKVYTDDAYVQGNQIMLTPLRDGFVKSIFTDDTYLTKKGDLLVELDDTDAKIALEAAKENLALKVREVCQSFHEVFALQADVQSKKAEYIKAAQDYEHRLYVLNDGGVSLEDFQHSEAALRTSFFLLRMTETLLEKALALVRNTSIMNHPEVVYAKDRARQAFVDLYRCKIYSPAQGLVAQRSIQVGMWVPSGTPLLSVIPLDQIWVNANYKETQMKRMRIGQEVKITADLYGDDVVFHGKIAGLPGGAGNAFSLLPPQNLSGNWIKIVQRLPVRVELDPDELLAHPLRIGLSLEALVNLKQKGPLVPSSTKGSPTYATDIFQYEETGDMSWIDEIILQNLDPSLTEFSKTPLN